MLHGVANQTRRPPANAFRWPLPTFSPVVELFDVLVIILAGMASGSAYQAAFLAGVRGDRLGFFTVSAVVATIFVIVGSQRGLYAPDAVRRPVNQFRRMAAIWALTFLLLTMVAFGLKIGAEFSRGFVIVFSAAGLLSVFAGRVLYAWLVTGAEARGFLRKVPVMLIGPARQVTSGATRASLGRAGYNVRQAFSWDEFGAGDDPERIAQEALAVARGSDVEEVLLVGNAATWRGLRDLLRSQPLPVHLIPDDDLADLVRRPVRKTSRLTFVEVQRGPLTAGERHAKRGLDFAIAGGALLLLLPFLVLVSVAIKLDSRGPVLFRQTRHGFNGRRFTILKFRSMSVQENGATVTQASRHDSRVTRVGRLLRRTSVDELPQLLNVLRGEMSIVGPRPHAIAHDNYYDQLIGNYAFRHHMKPGLTGWAQVNGFRGETREVELMERRVEHDIWYVDNCSIGLDLRIIARTFAELVRTRNAY